MGEKMSIMAIAPGLFEYLGKEGYETTISSMKAFTTLASRSEDTADLYQIEEYLRPIVVKNQKQDAELHEHVVSYFLGDTFESYRKKKTEYQDKKHGLERDIEQLKNRFSVNKEMKSEAEKELEKAKAAQAKAQEAYEKSLQGLNLPEKDMKKLRGNKLQPEFQKMAKKYDKENKETLVNLEDYMEGKKETDLKSLKKSIDSLDLLMKKSIYAQKPKEMMQFVSQKKKSLRKFIKNKEEGTAPFLAKKKVADDNVRREQNKIAENTRRMELAQTEMTQKERKLRELEEGNSYFSDMDELFSREEQILEKARSMNHREEFKGGKKAVISYGEGTPAWMDKEFKKLTDKEKQEIRAYIRENAMEFRTRMSGNIRVSHKKELDLAETCKKACQTDGVPIRLCWKKPVYRKTKLLLILDISGSCKEASELMLTFMYYMRECFSGGCLTYVFINSLYDVSSIMEEARSAEDAVKTILSLIPSRGVYSDYHRTLKEFYDSQMPKISSAYTFSFFMGDARNNKNPTGEEYIRAISRKCKGSYWLNTDKKEKWNQGDSIIGVYGNYMRSVSEIRTPGALLQMINDFRRN